MKLQFRVWFGVVGAMMFLCGGMTGCATKTQQVKTSQAQVYTIREAYNNVHLLKVGKRLLMIDAGLEKSALVIEARIRKLGLKPSSLVGIVVTHGHADHAGGALYFRKKYKTRIVAGYGDRELLRTGKNDKLCPTDSTGRSRLKESQTATYKPYQANIWVKKTSTMSAWFGIKGSIVPMPGHTKGSLVVVVGDAAFVGDLFRGSIVGSTAETHFYMCDLHDNKKDIANLLKMYPNVKHFFTGHFGSVSRDAVKTYLKRQK